MIMIIIKIIIVIIIITIIIIIITFFHCSLFKKEIQIYCIQVTDPMRCWEWLGRNVSVVLPAYAVKKISETFPFPSDNYTGFHPTL